MAGDFNRDGKQDIAMTTHPGPNAVFILQNTTAWAGCKAPSPSRTVKICSPSATVKNPVHFVANATDTKTITSIQVYVDHALKFTTTDDELNTLLTLSTGSHYLTVKAWDSAGAFSTSLTISVTP